MDDALSTSDTGFEIKRVSEYGGSSIIDFSDQSSLKLRKASYVDSEYSGTNVLKVQSIRDSDE